MKYTKEQIRAAVKGHYAANAKVTKARQMAASKTQDDAKKVEAERAKLVKKAADTLTANLPAPEFQPNQQHYTYYRDIAKAGFSSSLENGVTFKMLKDRLYVEGKSALIEVKALDLVAQAAALYSWSGIGRHLQDDKGEMPNHFTLHGSLIMIAAQHKNKQDRYKSSSEHLEHLVEAVLKSGFKVDANYGGREAVIDALVRRISDVSKRIGIQAAYDMSGALYMTCSDQPFGMAKLDLKNIEPYFQRIIDNTNAAGKLKGSADANRVMNGWIRSQKRI